MVSVRKRLQELDQLVATHTLKGLGDGTSHGLKTHVNTYVTFCTMFGLYLFTNTVDHFRRFVSHLTKTHSSIDSIKNYVSGAKNLFMIMGFQPPHIAGYIYNLTVKGITRVKDHVVKRALPVTPELLADLFPHVDLTDTKQVVVWVALLVGFYSFFRKSNLVPDSAVKYDNKKQLGRANIYRWSFMYVLKVYWAKNVQFRERELTIPLVPNIDKRICPVFWMEYMLKLVPGTSSDPAFSIPRGGQNCALSYNQLTTYFRKWLQLAGYPHKKYSSHSLRRGGASWAAHCGLPGHVIRLLGDWRSEAFMKYIDFSLKGKFEALLQFNMAMN